MLALPQALQGAVRFDMFVGYDGLVPQGQWLPIAFEIQNNDDGFVGTIVIEPAQLGGGHERSTKVELPSGTTKRLTIPVFATASWNPSWNARLLDERGRVRAQAESSNVRPFSAAQLPLAAALSRHSPTLPQVKSRQDNMRPVFGRIPASLLPDQPLALDGLDAFYLSSERAMELKPAQGAALAAWARGGGHLILSVEQPGHFTGPGAWLGAMIPGTIEGLGPAADAPAALQSWVTGELRHDGRAYRFINRNGSSYANPFRDLPADPQFVEAPFEAARITLSSPSTTTLLAGTLDRPLAFSRAFGLGRVTTLAFAPELEPFRSWRNAPWFWARLIDLSPELFSEEWPNQHVGRPVDAIFGSMIDSRQVRKLPVGWLLLLLVAYLVVIGPLDRYWLKKLNRQMLTWLTFPAYVAIFSLLIYFIGYRLRAGETEWRELHLVDILPHAGGADIRGRTYASIYSPINDRYTIVNEVANATLRGEFTGNYGGSDTSRGRIAQGAEGATGDLPVPVWTTQLYVSDWWRQEPEPVTLEVGAQEITVINHLQRPLVAARIVHGRQILEFPEVPPGATVTRPIASLTPENLDGFISSVGSSFANVAAARQQVFSDNQRGRIDHWTNAILAVSFLSRRQSDTTFEQFRASRGFDLNPALQSGRSVLIAWNPGHTPVPPMNRFSARRLQRDTVIRVLSRPAPAATGRTGASTTR